MSAFIYVFTIWCLATIFYASVDRLETNRRLALVLKLLILAVSAAATVRRLMRLRRRRALRSEMLRWMRRLRIFRISGSR